ncbi:probable LRR receptor-like serine/threonine-protein kinase At1g67720 isoform X2 [Ipomoea triloba]|uniref:probable LRR receptor-like serine/threonine-protein kinase At1g67720 isoform X2 n=1 Tax=Ipomoea triloba TaxID=35885 RepID=UPI00125DA763|nr:probable LRR receptor-like serine/threonine-protein kinase At1g67720 isoform X2 [Ipomoea triloba]
MVSSTRKESDTCIQIPKQSFSPSFSSSSPMDFLPQLFLLLAIFTPSIVCQVSEFMSIDCGGSSNYTDSKTGLAWISDSGIGQGKAEKVNSIINGTTQQYQTRREFPADNKKYCYTLSTKERRRYIVRATFLYGTSETDGGIYPKFQLYLDATKWGTITIQESSRIYVKEMVIRAPSKCVDVCVCCATTGSPFISTLELRPLNLSMYATDYEDDFYLKLAARVNFGAQSTDAIRYPDDPYDRIWDSDIDKRPNFLVGVAPGTQRINTTKHIDTNTREYPPVKVMQTGVVGTRGSLNYRLNLEDFPANARAYAYFAEIQDLGANETRKFKMKEPYVADYSNAVVNIAENANGSYTLYEPSYMNVTLNFVLSFSFVKTLDSTRGPLLNAMEISRYVKIAAKTDEQDVGSGWTEEGGDPCVPTQWEWLNCSTTMPPRITKIVLSGKNVKGEIPHELNNMEGLTELWLDGNSLTGLIPDMSNLINLEILHLENNNLTGALPAYLGSMPRLQELDVRHNSLIGEIPLPLLTGKVTFRYEGNSQLRHGSKSKSHNKLLIGVSVGLVAVLFILFIATMRYFRTKASRQRTDTKGNSLRSSTKPSTNYSSIARGGSLMDEGVACYISLGDIQQSTENFSKRIGKGSFGPVYHGKLRDGKEIAVKVMADSSSHGTKQFFTEVALLSRIHHRNLVPLIGYYEDEHQCMLVYEYMHNGTLRDHIHDPSNQKYLDWLERLRIAEDAAKGLEYLHTGCNPSIIHRDVKTSNILLDINMRAKVSDFGLSRQAEEDITHISSVARGTVGYLDPEYYAYQQLTEKSDVYSFGVVLLELITGRKPISSEQYGADWSIVHWVRSQIRKGDIVSVIDPRLGGRVKVESVWKIAEVAIQCVERHGYSRPRMQEVIMAIQDAIKIERGIDKSSSAESSRTQSSRKTLLTTFLDTQSPDISNGSLIPSAR